MHAQRRRLFAKPFSKSDLRRTWEPIVRAKVQLAVSQIVNELQDNGVSDILKWATLMATDVSTHLMFGESFEMLRVGEKNEYIQTLESAMMGSGLSVELPLLRTIGRFVPSESFRRLFRAGDYLFEYGKLAVTNGRQKGDSTRNIFSGIISESEKNEATLTDEDVAMEAGNLIMAGSDTTAVTLTYLIWAVLSQPALRSQLESELANLSDDYLDTDLETLSLLNATIMETLRLYGAAPGSLPRSVPQGGVTFSQYYLPHGTTVTTQSYTMHRDPNIFSNPEKFDPTRWLQTDHEVSDEVKIAFSPFGTGSRGCLGIHLSWMELRLAAAEFFRRCGNVRLAPSVNKDGMKPVHYFLIAPSAHKCEVVMDV
ncbi:cytochrome P450 [Penicillium riverlandense]|uniref:cytochrome P450 n=1 Tax=Penicillium riverlandense TaxID=1903569 RepID=UPI0025489941|nr:cytochrome P450 [Penicillium riverlandense]KAJ5826049.1 cytochrome P450 [Penicillium riverlandense]